MPRSQGCQRSYATVPLAALAAALPITGTAIRALTKATCDDAVYSYSIAAQVKPLHSVTLAANNE
jgi:hypothetical protein